MDQEGHSLDPRLQLILAELRRDLSSLYGQRLQRLVLYGSQARGDAVEGSDIDVMVVLTGDVDACAEVERTSEAVAGLSLKHAVVIACTFVSAIEFLHARRPLLLNVRREGVVI